MQSVLARLLRLALLLLLAALALRLVAAGRNQLDHGSQPQLPAPDRLGPVGFWTAIAVLVPCAIAAVGIPWALDARAARARAEWAAEATSGDPDRAPKLMVENGCAGCHTIPGVPGAEGRIGPELNGRTGQKFIAGVLPNTPENLIAWLRDARRFSPKTAMPSTFISGQDARDIAAYLYTLRP